MAFTYKEIRRAVRFKERDNDELKFSDYDIKDAVNEAIRYLSNSLADSNADFNERQRFYDSKDYGDINFALDGIALPDDFLALVAVKGKPHTEDLMTPCLSVDVPKPWEFKILGGKIYCGEPHFCLVYKAAIPEVEEDDDDIELPAFVKDVFVTLVRRILTSAEGDIMRDAQEEAVNALLPKRRYRNAKIRMPFQIGNHWHGHRW